MVRRRRRRTERAELLRRSLERTIRDGLEQTAAYVDRCGAETAHLVIFDRAADRSRDEKVFHRREPAGGVEVDVWGM